MKKVFFALLVSVVAATCSARTLYVSNITGDDRNDGLSEKTAFASI